MKRGSVIHSSNQKTFQIVFSIANSTFIVLTLKLHQNQIAPEYLHAGLHSIVIVTNLYDLMLIWEVHFVYDFTVTILNVLLLDIDIVPYEL